MEQYAFTAIIAVASVTAMIALLMGLEKMVRVIMANYFIASIILAFTNFIDLISGFLVSGKTERRVDGLQNRLGNMLIAGKPTILLAIYVVLLIFFFMKAHIKIGAINSNGLRILLTLILLPCTIISLVVGIAIALFGGQLVSLEGIKALAWTVSGIPYAYNLVLMTPVWMILPGLITLLMAILLLRKKEEEDDIAQKDILIEIEHK